MAGAVWHLHLHATVSWASGLQEGSSGGPCSSRTSETPQKFNHTIVSCRIAPPSPSPSHSILHPPTPIPVGRLFPPSVGSCVSCRPCVAFRYHVVFLGGQSNKSPRYFVHVKNCIAAFSFHSSFLFITLLRPVPSCDSIHRPTDLNVSICSCGIQCFGHCGDFPILSHPRRRAAGHLRAVERRVSSSIARCRLRLQASFTFLAVQQ